MLTILLIAMILMSLLFLLCACVISSRCSIEEENHEQIKNV